jgi:hypothetical protein
MTRGTGPPSAGDGGANVSGPGLGVVRRRERPAHRRSTRSGGNADASAVAANFDLAAAAGRDLEADLGVLVDEYTLAGDDDGREPLLPSTTAAAASFSVPELEIGGTVKDAFRSKARLVFRAQPPGRLAATAAQDHGPEQKARVHGRARPASGAVHLQ